MIRLGTKRASKKKRERKKFRPKTFLGFNYSVLVSCELGGVVYQHLLGQSFRRGSVKKIEFGTRQLFLIYFFLIYFRILCCGCYRDFFSTIIYASMVNESDRSFVYSIHHLQGKKLLYCTCENRITGSIYICSEHRRNKRNLIVSES